MRKAKLLAFSAMAGLMSLVTVNAKEMTLTELGNEALKYAPNARFIFVVGKYAYTSTYDQFNTQDIMLASADSIDLNKNGNISGQVGNMTIYRIDRTYDKSNKPNGWKAGKNEIGKGTELKDNKVDIKYIDYHSLSSLDIDAHVLSAIEKLNETGEDEDGFSSITYKDKTATFNISDPSKKLADYKNAALDAIKAFVSANNAVSVTYNKKETKLTEGTLDDVVTKLAAEVLRDMAGAKDSSIETSSLNYASVANKSAQATVKYVDEDGNTVNVTYTLKFVYDFKKEKNEVLTDVASTLDSKIKENGNKEKYGFNGVTYSNEKLTFDVYDPSVNLATFADSGIVDLFKKNYIGATNVVLKMSGKTDKTIEIGNQDLTDELVKKYAAEALLFMSGNDGDNLEAENAKDLTIKSVIGKTLTAEVTYADGKKVTYTLEFKFNADEVKDEILTEYAKELNEEQGFLNMGFKSVDFNSTNNNVTFNINNPDGQFYKKEDETNTKAIESIVEMFNSFAAGATEVTYTVNGSACTDDQNNCKFTFDGNENDTKNKVMQLALQLLLKMSEGGTDNGLTVGSVVGSYADATFTYANGETVKYHVVFNYDIQESIYESLDGYASGLQKIDSKNGQYFDSIVFDKETGKATFTYKSDKASSKFADYVNKSQVVDMFDVVTKYATEFSWTVGSENGTCKKSDSENCTATKLAKEVLNAMAKAKASNGATSKSEADLTLADVEGQEATATVTYKVGKETKTITVKLVFVQTSATS